MQDFSITRLLRQNIKDLVAYSSARSEYSGEAEILLDANENSMGSPIGKNLNRYPDPLQLHLKELISNIKQIDADHIFVGNGSDEIIDLLFRAFCNPGIDKVMVFPPSYGMYEVAARINDVEIKAVNLNKDFQIEVPTALQQIEEQMKLVFICNPNNPTGNLIQPKSIETLLQNSHCLVVVDEAYIDFSSAPSWIKRIKEYPNLVIIQTLSKAWGLAGLRVGIGFASPEIIAILNKIKAPYNLSSVAQEWAQEALLQEGLKEERVKLLNAEKQMLSEELSIYPFIEQVFPSEANFLLVAFKDARAVYHYLKRNGIITRNRSSLAGCNNCLRISIGTQSENKQLLTTLNQYQNEKESTIY